MWALPLYYSTRNPSTERLQRKMAFVKEDRGLWSANSGRLRLLSGTNDEDASLQAPIPASDLGTTSLCGRDARVPRLSHPCRQLLENRIEDLIEPSKAMRIRQHLAGTLNE